MTSILNGGMSTLDMQPWNTAYKSAGMLFFIYDE
jgi:hypothetical protein